MRVFFREGGDKKQQLWAVSDGTTSGLIKRQCFKAEESCIFESCMLLLAEGGKKRPLLRRDYPAFP